MMTTPLTSPLVRRRLATDVALRSTLTRLLDTIAHLRADLACAERDVAAADLRENHPAFYALLATRVASTPAATIHDLDRALLDLALAPQVPLERWVTRLATALAA